ncbi:hypothetical protein BKA67DRAFT_541659 [Truncatella angustata]|uniref:Uncharacterized protein n=1 Tax=Truncatella angustata TaxID=152316 RepID=A0A9P8UB23_9PEZI|nr:uncharacterized protein BKA67DRAFT_541659 [Truncatella angustata]KAH6645437.1 hypothetical protein BKA67DRAFT_541659 [Truncatella angustata]KAH8198212.1 hypothetical protein TruAng_007639 [Truncatella angustata]
MIERNFSFEDVLRAGLSGRFLSWNEYQVRNHQSQNVTPLNLHIPNPPLLEAANPSNFGVANQPFPLLPGYTRYPGTSEFADPYINNIHISTATTLAAFVANASAIGLTFAQFSQDDAVSPFCISPLQDQSTDPHSLETGLYNNIARDLRPAANQITTSHHPYLDVIPFPEFRSRAISVLDMDPPLIDEDELCADLVGGGVICWGGYRGVGHGRGEGTPWDMRSWEAAPWFLRKWWMLTGDENCEMWSHAKWWWALRGGNVTDRRR